jgi:hypothetical protein
MSIGLANNEQRGIGNGWIMPRICRIGNQLAAGYNQFAPILSDKGAGSDE